MKNDADSLLSLAARGGAAVRVTGIGLLLNAVLTLFKYAAGFWGHSGAMIADATHSLSDLVTDVVVLFGFRVVQKPEDDSHDFGHGKVETFLAFVCGVFLLLAGTGIFWNGMSALVDAFGGNPLQSPAPIALAAAFVSVVSKELLYRYTVRWGRKLDSSALIAKAWDHRSDAFSSVGTLIGIGGAMGLGEHGRVLDPLAAIVVSVFVVKVSLPMLSESVGELLESSLDEETELRIVSLIEENGHVCGVHKLRTRKIGFYMAIDAHVLVPRHLSIVDAHDVATLAEHALERAFGEHTIVSLHVEPEPEGGGPHEEGILEGRIAGS